MKVIGSFGLGKEAIKSPKKYDCVLGISVGARYFSKKLIEKYIIFCQENFDKVLIIIVDEIKKYNWMAIQNLSEDKAKAKAIFEGSEMKEAVKKIIKNIKQNRRDISKVQVIDWAQAIRLVDDFNDVNALLKNYFLQNETFRNDCLLMVKTYIQTRKEITDHTALNVSANFLLEETALFLMLGKSTGYCIDVYPGKFPIMKNIIEGKYPDLEKKLPKGIRYGHIEISE